MALGASVKVVVCDVRDDWGEEKVRGDLREAEIATYCHCDVADPGQAEGACAGPRWGHTGPWISW